MWSLLEMNFLFLSSVICWLEVNCYYYFHFFLMKVQGRDRLYVKFIADSLGLDASYIPRTYIEQIQLEKLLNDVMVRAILTKYKLFQCSWFWVLQTVQALPDDLKTKLSIDDDLVSSPREALSRASADRRTKFLNR